MKTWPVGGRRLTKEQREAILETYLREGKEAADNLAASHGLSPGYAYGLANGRGLLPITRWDTHRNA